MGKRRKLRKKIRLKPAPRAPQLNRGGIATDEIVKVLHEEREKRLDRALPHPVEGTFGEPNHRINGG